MTQPVLTSNSPSAGYIAWTAFTIRYGTSTVAITDYAVNAGNTNNKFVWWLWNGGSPILQSGNTIPVNWTEHDMLLFINKAGVGAKAYQTQVVEGSLIVGESILTDQISANAVTAAKVATDAIETRHIKALQIEGGQIKANQIAANHIVGGSISTSKLTVGALYGNLAPNPFFEDWPVGQSLPDGWAQIGGAGWSATISRETATPITGTISVGMTPAASNYAGITTIDYIPIAGGQDVFLTAYYAGTGTALGAGIAIAVYYYDLAGSLISSTQTNADITGSNTIQAIQHVDAAPATAKSMRPVIITAHTTKTIIDNLEFGHRLGQTQIADGAITTEKLSSDFIYAGQITGDQITGGTISVGSSYWNTTDGLVIPQPSGASIIFPVNGNRAQIRGAGADLDSLSVTGATELLGSSTLSNTLTLNSTVSAPASAPTLESTFPTLIPTTAINYGGIYAKSLTDTTAGTDWLAVGNVDGVGQGVFAIGKSTGAVSTAKLKTGTEIKHVVRVGTKYVVGEVFYVSSQYRYTIKRYDSAWALEATLYDELETTHNFTCLGTNGTQILAFTNNGGQTVRRYNLTTGAHESSRTLSSAFSGCYGLYEGAADLGTSRIVAAGNSGNINVHSLADGTRISAEGWPAGASITPYGLHWDGTRFWSIRNDGTIYKYSTYISASSDSATASQTITDGTAETAKSPASVSVTRYMRGWYKITANAPPGTPSGLYPKMYIGASGTRRLVQSPSPALGVGVLSTFVETLSTTNAVEPASQSGTFASGGLGRIKSAKETVSGTPDIDLRGDGFGYVRYDPATAHRCVLTKSATQSTAHITVATVTWENESVDVGGLGDVANDRIVIQRARLYSLECGITMAAMAEGRNASVGIMVNGTRVAIDSLQVSGNNSERHRSLHAKKSAIYLAAGDLITAEVYQNNGVATNIESAYPGSLGPGTFLEAIELR